MSTPDSQLLGRFGAAVKDLDGRFPAVGVSDENAEADLHNWLDVPDPLPWTRPDRVTEDEWFFVTNLYGQMTLAGQRSHIRKFFLTLFVQTAQRDLRSFVPGMLEFRGLQYPWMSQRLWRIGEVLRERAQSMAAYVEALRGLDAAATMENPTPALDAFATDLRVGERKTLSVFVRDCVFGYCFPLDSRVRAELALHDLPPNEALLVRMAREIDRNPRPIARMFYAAGGSKWAGQVNAPREGLPPDERAVAT